MIELDAEEEVAAPAGDEWGTCACTFDEDGLLVGVCSEHGMLVWQGEALLRQRMDRELDERLQVMFARTNLAPVGGAIANFKVQKRR